jgi:Protein of unknown function (DUF3363)
VLFLGSRDKKPIGKEQTRQRLPLLESRFQIGGGLGHLDGFGEYTRVVPQPNLLATLRRRELDAVGAKLSADTGPSYTPAAGGEMVAGTCRQRLTLTSGWYAMIDSGLAFALVPWTPAIEKDLGRHVAGVAKESGGIEWGFGRKRELEI